MTVRLLMSDRTQPDMGGNNRVAHLHDKGNSVSVVARTDAEAKQKLVKVARKFAADLNKWCDSQEKP